jgi:maltooligosyltrehalose synthase
LLASAYAQLRFLARNLEHDVRGNHLVANLRALVCGAVFFDGDEPRRWRDTALRLPTGAWLDLLTGDRVVSDSAGIALDGLLARLPVALLVRE